MYKGIYIIVSSASVKDLQMSYLARNIANVSTAGYKRAKMVFRAYNLPDNFPISTKTGIDIRGQLVTDYSHGELNYTGRNLDLAIEGDGFFVLEGGFYTRKGSFMIDPDGYLIGPEGKRVLSEGDSPISIPQGKAVEVSQDGEIFVDGASVGRLKIVDFPKPYQLQRVGDAVFVPTGGQEPVEPEVRVFQGFLESSNVKVVEELVHMVSLVRQFEAYQKLIKAFDESSSKAINEIGRI
ncbi:MAG: flagellar hook basal-body protein [Nitrospirae bacterium]|nr:MAG: flagellar hook basal-body protein [Nitrospirota bacterium]